MGPRVGLFIAFWTVAGIGALSFYRLNRDAALKRRVHPWVTSLAGALLLLSGALLGLLDDGLWLIILGLLFIATAVCRFAISFCTQCGSATFGLLRAQTEPCPRCGAPGY